MAIVFYYKGDDTFYLTKKHTWAKGLNNAHEWTVVEAERLAARYNAQWFSI